MQAKNLSVNYVDFQRHLAERDDSGGDVVECDEAAFEFLVAHQQLAKSVEPAMTDPAPRLLGWVAPLGLGLLGTTDHMRDVAVCLDDRHGRAAAIPGVRTQMLAASLGWRLALDHDGLEHRIELSNVMSVGPGHDERQRDTTAVDQEVALAAIFSPDQSDWLRPPLVPMAL